mmetsp:Transcript_58738/g.182466  ORF Transcript_58738/g.182466 Transcript_58738/m.182466 type:complete len:152 (+) Transcript_58738:152-607(+)
MHPWSHRRLQPPGHLHCGDRGPRLVDARRSRLGGRLGGQLPAQCVVRPRRRSPLRPDVPRGFLPQIYVFFSTRSIGGFAFGMVALDLVGSGANIALCFEPSGIAVADALVASLPFLMIIAMHVVLVSVAAGVALSNRCYGRADRGMAADGV